MMKKGTQNIEQGTQNDEIKKGKVRIQNPALPPSSLLLSAPSFPRHWIPASRDWILDIQGNCPFAF